MISLHLASHAPHEILRTEVPLTIVVSGESLAVLLKNYRYTLVDQQQRHSVLPVRPLAAQQQILLQFHVFLPGLYRIEVHQGKELMEQLPLKINQQQYLSFKLEFGVFLILLVIVTVLGGWIWSLNNKKSI